VKRLAILLMWLAIGMTGAMAQAYPDRVVRIVVPYPPGGSYDVIGRLVAQSLSARWGQQVIVENRGGVSGDLGSAAVASSAPDGYTLLLYGDSLLINQALIKNRAFDPVNSFTPISLVARSPQVLVANPALKVTTLPALLDLAKRDDSDITFGTAGTGSPGQLAAELLAVKSQAKFRHVPYRGGALVMTDLLGNQISLASMGLPAVLANIRSGKIVAIAVSSAKRAPQLPNVQAMNEVVPSAFFDTWYGLLGPAGMPAPLVKKIQEDLKASMGTPELVARLDNQGYEFVGSTSEELRTVIVRDLPHWQEVVTIVGMKPTEPKH
jgi:tripartite-type tricarboxylate transporter receptor subunit TctC